jgi:radical SAM superfamily enzyme YgiQ (UPF0313 family)
MKIILVRTNAHSLHLVPPLGIGFISAYLNKNGIDTVIIDGLRDKLSNNKILDLILKEKPDAVGITCLTAGYNEVIELSNLVKKHNLKCIIGCIHPSFLPYQTLLDSKADFVICGEGERSFLELAKNKFVNNNIQGVYSLNNLKSEAQAFEFSNALDNLDEIAMPSWEKLLPHKYKGKSSGIIYKNMPIGYIMTSRGCASNCTFCASPEFFKRRVRFRSVENVINEILELKNKYGIREIKFIDDNFIVNKERALRICKLIIENKINLPWACSCGVRADDIDEEIVTAMEKAGCYNINIGIESANPQILLNVNKAETIEQINNAIEITAKYGIVCGGLFLFGLPGETKETMRQSIDFAKKSKLTLATFNILDILPGARLWNDLNYKFNKNNLQNSYCEPKYVFGGIQKEDIIKAQKRAFIEFYFRPKIMLKLLPFVKAETIKYFFKRVFKRIFKIV